MEYPHWLNYFDFTTTCRFDTTPFGAIMENSGKTALRIPPSFLKLAYLGGRSYSANHVRKIFYRSVDCEEKKT
jgi:hypothetical protein